MLLEHTIFTSERLFLRPFMDTDKAGVQRYMNDPALAGRRYAPWDFPKDLPLSAAQVEQIFKKIEEQKNGFTYAIVLQAGGDLIGHAHASWGWDTLCPDIHIVIAPPLQRHGYGSEVLDMLLTYLFEETVANNVSSWMADWNTAARQFAAKHGFQEAGQEQRAGLRDGKYYNEVVVDMLRAEWQARKGGE